MNCKNLIDCHTHTLNSPDGIGEPSQMVEKAIELGLSAYAITDHCECNTWYSFDYYNYDANEYDDEEIEMYDCINYHSKSMSSFCELKEKYSDKMNLICGVELGQATQELSIAEKIVSEPDLDFIIGSLHNNAGCRDFAFMNYDKMSLKDISLMLDNYFEQVLELCEWSKFDVLGHLTYPLRYICGEYKIPIDISGYNRIIEKIFTTLIKNGKGIEINTSGLRQPYGKTFPDVDYVKMYKSLGGEILSLGSDSHCVRDLGGGIAEGAEIARLAGFSQIAYFKKHKPKFISL